jgi:hypothetical protein
MVSDLRYRVSHTTKGYNMLQNCFVWQQITFSNVHASNILFIHKQSFAGNGILVKFGSFLWMNFLQQLAAKCHEGNGKINDQARNIY